jgi:hypothetical protein
MTDIPRPGGAARGSRWLVQEQPPEDRGADLAGLGGGEGLIAAHEPEDERTEKDAGGGQRLCAAWIHEVGGRLVLSAEP